MYEGLSRSLCRLQSRGNLTYSPFDGIFFEVMQPDNGSAQLGPRLCFARFLVQSVVRTLEQPSITVLQQLSQEVMDMTQCLIFSYLVDLLFLATLLGCTGVNEICAPVTLL